MQRRVQCFNCSQQFNKGRNQPKILDCLHIICFQCALKLSQQNQLKCPWCNVVTQKDPFDLQIKIEFLMEETSQSTNFCSIHTSYERLLYCKEDQACVCNICAFSGIHKGHNISVLNEIIENIKQNELQNILQEKERSERQLDEYLHSLKENQTQILSQFQQMQQEVNLLSQDIIKQVNQAQESKIQSLRKDEENIKQKFEEEIANIEQQKQLLEVKLPNGSENPIQLIDFIVKIREVISQAVQIKKMEVQIESKNNSSQVSQSLDNFYQYQVKETNIGFQQKVNLQTKREEYEVISTMSFNSKNKKIFYTSTKSFNEKQLGVEQLNLNYTQVEQIKQENLLITGGGTQNQTRFINHSENKVQQFSMLFPRGLHKTCFNQNNKIYIISGVNHIDGQAINIPECEIFDISSEQFSTIQSIQEPIHLFGCDQFDQKVLVFGGYKQSIRSVQDKIQQYDSITNT